MVFNCTLCLLFGRLTPIGLILFAGIVGLFSAPEWLEKFSAYGIVAAVLLMSLSAIFLYFTSDSKQ